ncbi:hypothetical protein [Aliivibrio sifiae]|uniref:Uncharacterized protein n=1 Tax=Aliivibrio sifiae TaxID=566293 RepID=A0A2S7X2W6_9GAMM|nr:hypothetical protein [Aliivibrio sifiae]PQJ84561.1 hypothetical protein BTO22_13675 [Aliivibrio sifiae]
MRDFINGIFWLTSIAYGATILSVPYVGVYLTYVAVPIIVISGLILWLTRNSKVDVNALRSQINHLEQTLDTVIEQSHILFQENKKLREEMEELKKTAL